ncbi:hypothetical protein HNQ81_002701 [Desulfoprunum benzoelyticum]|uniref:Uncharacterized protein n=1 Tax=Desulfoprunum benzoelyticum TaxID=1506996 RepID=A0A840V4Y6_9BACT|nr:hypothetical protein [Desulfoprunum benzoelyticum]
MGILPHQHHIERWPVGDDFPALTIKNVTTGGNNLANTNSVGVGPVLVFLTMVDLQRPESDDDQGKKDQHNNDGAAYPTPQVIERSCVTFRDFIRFL